MKTVEERAEAKKKRDEQNRRAAERRRVERLNKSRQSTLPFGRGSPVPLAASARSSTQPPFRDMTHTIKLTEKAQEVRAKHIRARLSMISNRTASNCLGLAYEDSAGKKVTYSMSDMKYDLSKGYIE